MTTNPKKDAPKPNSVDEGAKAARAAEGDLEKVRALVARLAALWAVGVKL